MEQMINEIMASSSSSSSESSDSNFELELLMLASCADNSNRKKMRVIDFVTDVVEEYSEEVFRSHFRLGRSTADYIVAKYENSSHFKANEGVGRRIISPRTQILAFLWFCANKNTYREICNLFNIAESTFCKHMDNILSFFQELAKSVIRFPQTPEQKEEVSSGFEKIGNFKNVIGCIDGSYICIRKPAKKIRSTYANRHDLLSITLQGICDSDKKFLDVCIGAPSKVHDARLFALSPISDTIAATCDGKYHLLGDAAYPLREYLLTPYRDCGQMTAKERRNNYKHCQTRVKIENAFGLLKQRFRQLIRLDFFTVEKMSKFVLACCVLHNICLSRNDVFEFTDEGTSQDNSPSSEEPTPLPVATENSSTATLRRLGEIKRSNIAETFT